MTKEVGLMFDLHIETLEISYRDVVKEGDYPIKIKASTGDVLQLTVSELKTLGVLVKVGENIIEASFA